MTRATPIALSGTPYNDFDTFSRPFLTAFQKAPTAHTLRVTCLRITHAHRVPIGARNSRFTARTTARWTPSTSGSSILDLSLILTVVLGSDVANCTRRRGPV